MASKDSLFCLFQRLFPQHLVSRIAGALANVRQPWIKNLLISAFIRRFAIDLEEAESADKNTYPSFNAFFTRALKPDARSIDSGLETVISPADGMVSQIGSIREGKLVQAKGIDYRLNDLLADAPLAKTFDKGFFATIYLSPRDYHRVHMPFAGQLIRTTYLPGRLFSVNAATTKALDNLFTRNERLVCQFDSPAGPFVLVLVGATLVAGIETVWEGQYAPASAKYRDHRPDTLHFEKGEEIGRFKFGSTVILLLPPQAAIDGEVKTGQLIKMGEKIARLPGNEHAQHQP